jgi:hypothetical protein
MSWGPPHSHIRSKWQIQLWVTILAIFSLLLANLAINCGNTVVATLLTDCQSCHFKFGKAFVTLLEIANASVNCHLARRAAYLP